MTSFYNASSKAGIFIVITSPSFFPVAMQPSPFYSPFLVFTLDRSVAMATKFKTKFALTQLVQKYFRDLYVLANSSSNV